VTWRSRANRPGLHDRSTSEVCPSVWRPVERHHGLGVNSMLDGIRILAVHHDSGLNGATLLFQSVLERLSKDHGAVIRMRFPREGPIVARARELGPVDVAALPAAARARDSFARRVARRLGCRLPRERPITCDLIFANSVASLAAVERIPALDGTPLVVYVHESHFLLHNGDFQATARMLRRADLIIAVSAAVRRTLEDVIQPSARIAIVTGFPPERPATVAAPELPPAVRAAISSGAKIIGGVGTIVWYKGTDLFVAVARRIRQLLPRQQLRFIWIGEEGYSGTRRLLQHDIRRAELEGVVLLPGETADPTSFYQSLSLFLLPSREDSWPLVMLEAATAGVPMVCFQGSGGAEEFVASGGGTAVPYLDVEAMAQAAARYLSDPDLMARDSRIARELGRSVTGAEQTRKIASELAAMLASRPKG
jgi:glycosyltransferase involved in cell wall biosynthesis